jgi:beta-lactamase class A
MKGEWTRRGLLLGMGATLATACARGASPSPPESTAPRSELDTFAAIEASVGGRVGVFALDTGSGNHLAHRENERFAMCSTFKWALVAAVLARVDRREVSLEERVRYGRSDLLEYAPTTRDQVSDGAMTVEALAKAAITKSDNTAANLLLMKVDGPPGLTQFFRRLGDPVTRLDRNEPTLNTNIRGDVRDTTSPHAMVSLMRSVLCGDVLSLGGRDRLIGWLCACETGHERLRAGLPPEWTVGDKTGTGLGGAVDDIAIVVPPRRAPILIASYLSDSVSSLASLSAAHREIGRIVAKQLVRSEPTPAGPAANAAIHTPARARPTGQLDDPVACATFPPQFDQCKR